VNNTDTQKVIKVILSSDILIRKVSRLVDNHKSISLLEGKIFDILYSSDIQGVEKHMLYKVDYSAIVKEFQ